MARLNIFQGIPVLLNPEWSRNAPDGRSERHRPLRGRFQAGNEEPVAVFLVGMRINRLRALRHWLPVMFGMPGMLKELSEDPDSGLLGYRLLGGPGPRQVTVLQYWRRAGDVRAFAQAEGRTHNPAQQAFWKHYFRSNGAVGIWHEMYSVRAGAYQCVYGDMPATGMGAVSGLHPVVPAAEGGYRPSDDPVFTAQITGR